MLVLTVKDRDCIVIGDGLIMVHVSDHGGKIRLAFDAPRDIRIDRKEVHDRRKAFPPLRHNVDAGG